MSTLPTTIPPKALDQAILSTDSDFKLNNIKGWDDADLTSAEFGTVAFGAFLSKDRTILELFSFDPTTIASASITFVDRGLDFTGANTVVAANKRDWEKGTTVLLGTDTPQFMFLMAGLGNNNAFTGTNTFSQVPSTTGGFAVAGGEFVNKDQLDAATLGQIGTDKVIIAATAGETIADGDAVYFDTVTNNEWMKCDANTAASVNNVLIGIAQGAGTDGVAISGGVLILGTDDAQAGMTIGDIMYFSDTAGDFSSTPGTVEVTAGIAKSATEIDFKPRFNQQLTEDQQDALAGTSGTPSTSNRYVTNDDTTSTSEAGKALRLDGSGDLPVISGVNLTGVVIGDSFTATENIVDREAVSIFPYQSDGGISYNGSDSLIGNQASSNTTVSKNVTVASGSNKMMVIAVSMRQSGSGNPDPVAPTYSGDSMIEISKSGGRNLGMTAMYYLSNPDEGSNALSWIVNGLGVSSTLYYAWNVYIFDNASSTLASSGSAAASTFNYTPSEVGEIVIPAFFADNAMSSAVNFATNEINQATQSAGVDDGIYTGWSGQIAPAIQNTFSVTSGDSAKYAALAPFTTATFKSVALSDASSVDNTAQLDKYALFTGIAREAITAGSSGKIAVSGPLGGFTGLKPFAVYYLSDTPGAISTSQGTNSKKIGYAISTTEIIIITNN